MKQGSNAKISPELKHGYKQSKNNINLKNASSTQHSQVKQYFRLYKKSKNPNKKNTTKLKKKKKNQKLKIKTLT